MGVHVIQGLAIPEASSRQRSANSLVSLIVIIHIDHRKRVICLNLKRIIKVFDTSHALTPCSTCCKKKHLMLAESRHCDPGL